MVHEYAMGTAIVSLRAIDDGAAEATRRVRDEEVARARRRGLPPALEP